MRYSWRRYLGVNFPLFFALALLALQHGGLVVPSADAAEGKSASFELRITDEDSGLNATIKRQVVIGTSAFEALKASVTVEVKEYPGLGVRVLKLCDVQPVRGKHWGLYVDGKKSEVGIAGIKIEKDILIEWKTQP